MRAIKVLDQELSCLPNSGDGVDVVRGRRHLE